MFFILLNQVFWNNNIRDHFFIYIRMSEIATIKTVWKEYLKHKKNKSKIDFKVVVKQFLKI